MMDQEYFRNQATDPVPGFNLSSMREELCELISIARETRIELEGKLDAIQGTLALNQLAAGMATEGPKSPAEPTIQVRFQELRKEISRLSKASGRL